MNEKEEKNSLGVGNESLSPTQEWCECCKTEHVPDNGICAEERLRMRRAFMPDYDRKLEEWLS